MSMRKCFGAMLAVFIAFLLALSGCGDSSSGGGDSGGQAPPQQLVFNEATMLEAANVAVGIVEIFPDLTGVLLEMIDPLTTMAARATVDRTAAALVPLGDIGLCTNTGGSLLSYDDADLSGSLSAGDAATLEFNQCSLEVTSEVLNGTLTISFTAVTLPTSVAARVTSSPSLVLTYLSDSSTETLTLDFGLQITQTLTEVTLVYGDPTAMDTIGFVDDLGLSVQLGCFDVIQSIDLPMPKIPSYTLAPRGIANFDGLIMQMGSYETATMDVPLDFAGLIPNSGTITLFNFDGRPAGPCTAIGSSGTAPLLISAERITATGGADVIVETFDDVDLTPPADDTVFTTWMQLVDTP